MDLEMNEGLTSDIAHSLWAAEKHLDDAAAALKELHSRLADFASASGIEVPAPREDAILRDGGK